MGRQFDSRIVEYAFLKRITIELNSSNPVYSDPVLGKDGKMVVDQDGKAVQDRHDEFFHRVCLEYDVLDENRQSLGSKSVYRTLPIGDFPDTVDKVVKIINNRLSVFVADDKRNFSGYKLN